jgi:hypothetical protein
MLDAMAKRAPAGCGGPSARNACLNPFTHTALTAKSVFIWRLSFCAKELLDAGANDSVALMCAITNAINSACARRLAMKIDSTEFGSITIDGSTFPHDVLIRLSGEVVKRKKKLSKKYYGTSHIVSREEAEFIYEKGCDILVLGAGQYGNVTLSPEAAEYFAQHDCRVILLPTAEAIKTYNATRNKAKTVGLFHVTC